MRFKGPKLGRYVTQKKVNRMRRIQGTGHADSAKDCRDIEIQIQIIEERFGTSGSALMPLYTEDARILSPGNEVIEGKEAIGKYWQSVFDSGEFCMDLETVDIEVINETGIEQGTYRMTDQNAELVDRGKYIVIWKKIDGVWKLHRDISHSDESGAGSL